MMELPRRAERDPRIPEAASDELRFRRLSLEGEESLFPLLQSDELPELFDARRNMPNGVPEFDPLPASPDEEAPAPLEGNFPDSLDPEEIDQIIFKVCRP